MSDRPYPSDLSDAEWVALKPLFPPPSRIGRPLKWPRRAMAEAIFYGCHGTSHRGRPSTPSPTAGAATARSSGCTTRCATARGRRLGVTESPRLP